MKIKYIAWKKVICSDVNRLIYATQEEIDYIESSVWPDKEEK